jgi:ADP-ribose pyrophosphatase
MLPFIGRNTILLEYQYRPVLKKYIYELPAGHIDKGETPEHAAKRELEEETGFAPKTLKLMFKAYSTPGSSAQMYNCFVATGLHKSNVHLEKDPDEIISIKRVSLDKIMQMVKSKKIIDTKTIAAVLYYTTFLKKKR